MECSVSTKRPILKRNRALTSLEQPVLIAFLSEDWDSPPAGFTRRPLLLAVHRKLAAEGWRTLAVERPICPVTTSLFEPCKMAQELLGKRRLRPAADGLHLATPVVALRERLARRVRPVQRANARLLKAQLSTWLRLLGLETRPRVVWLFHPRQSWLVDVTVHDALIYECYDEYAGLVRNEAVRASLYRAESSILSHADLVLTTSSELYSSRRRHNPNTLLVNNGVNYELFASGAGLPEPDDVVGVPHPRIGFAGIINRRLDLDLLSSVAAARPDWNLLMLGPVREMRRRDLAQLRGFPNVHFLHSRPQAEVPAYLAHCDVNIIPYARNGTTAATYPLKLNEYLAVGRPVVSTDFSADLAEFAGLVRVACTRLGFIAAIAAALDEDKHEYAARAQALARNASWECRADKVAAAILESASGPWRREICLARSAQ